MHNNYYLLRVLSRELEVALKNSVLSECFSQNKDELILRFETKSSPIYIKASLQSDFCCLSFPNDFNRARKNSVDLFEDIIGQRVQTVRQFTNERCFSLQLSGEFELLFKMHGNRSNIILFHTDKDALMFRNHLHQDKTLSLQNLDVRIDWSKDAFLQHINNLKMLYFTFGKIIWEYLDTKNFQTLSADKQWEEIQDLLKLVEHPTIYCTELNNRLALSLVPIGKIVSTYSTACSGLDAFFTQYSIQTGLMKEREALLSKLTMQIKNVENYVNKSVQKLREIESKDHYKVWADLIMANLHQIKPGMDHIILPDFFQDQQIDVKLKKDLSPQKNAEVYYRKSKNHHIEVEKLKETITRKQQETKMLEAQHSEIANTTDLKTLRNLGTTFGIIRQTEKDKPVVPYHEVEFQGFKIWIGKNAKHNDVLTLKYTFKDDLWLHAKDVAGSHVVVKHQSGKQFSKEVIERAAQLAAYYSKRKTDSLCPVAYTQKKYVRKRKGDVPGMVIVDRETVIMVVPTGQ